MCNPVVECQNGQQKISSKITRKVIITVASGIILTLLLVVLATLRHRTATHATLTCGQRPGDFERPWMVEIYILEDDSWNRWGLAGTILSRRYVLIPSDNYHWNARDFDFRVLFGENDLPNSVSDAYFENRTYRGVIREDAIIHREFDYKSRMYDLAILRLDKDVDFNDRVQPICLPDVQPVPPEHFVIFPKDFKDNSSVYQVDMARCSRKWAKEGIPNSQEIIESHACVKMEEHEEEPCNSVDGSPLLGSFLDHGVERFVQYGFKHHGDSADGLQIYTKVNYYLEWILEKISK